MRTSVCLALTNRELDRVVALVAEKCSVSKSDMFGESRVRPVVEARWFLMYVLRNRYDMSLPQIACVTRRDHSTVMGGLSNFPRTLDREPFYRHALAAIEWLLDEEFADLPNPLKFSEVA